MKNIRADLNRFHRSCKPLSFVCALKLFLFNFGLQALVVYRFGRWLLTLKGHPTNDILRFSIYPVYCLLQFYVRVAYGIDLDLSADIGPGLYIGHFGGIRVRCCRLGSICAIQQNVVISPRDGGDRGPIVGSRVWIGANARLTGDIIVSDGVTIGAGAFVTKHVKPRCLILGNPAREVLINYENSLFL